MMIFFLFYNMSTVDVFIYEDYVVLKIVFKKYSRTTKIIFLLEG